MVTETDRLGGYDPYSASKAAVGIAIKLAIQFLWIGCSSTPFLKIATARAGNVIGGGDWSDNRILPDAMGHLFGVNLSLFVIHLQHDLGNM